MPFQNIPRSSLQGSVDSKRLSQDTHILHIHSIDCVWDKWTEPIANSKTGSSKMHESPLHYTDKWVGKLNVSHLISLVRQCLEASYPHRFSLVWVKWNSFAYQKRAKGAAIVLWESSTEVFPPASYPVSALNARDALSLHDRSIKIHLALPECYQTAAKKA